MLSNLPKITELASDGRKVLTQSTEARAHYHLPGEVTNICVWVRYLNDGPVKMWEMVFNIKIAEELSYNLIQINTEH